MKILFVCTANSCRSQMAEGWARHLAPAGWTIASAGLMTYPISRRTRAVMEEVGLDLAGQETKSIDVFDLDSFDLVVTLSEEAGSYLPALQDPQRHWRRPFTDPMAATGTPDEVRQAFRTGRDQARQVVLEVLDACQGPRTSGGLSSDR
jgi:arsenate reductase (thioredoxin)